MTKARQIRDQLFDMCERIEVELSSNPDTIAVRKAIVSGFFYNTARLEKNAYKTTKTKSTVKIHPSSVLHESMPRTGNE